MVYAGASEAKITPYDSQFLYGYPHVERYSNGVHDDLMTAALYLEEGRNKLLFISNDIIFVTKVMAKEIRAIIGKETGLREEQIMVTATHTHSGPITVDAANSTRDPIVPKFDRKYVAFAVEQMAKNGIAACKAKIPATIGFATADSTGIGTNRRDPDGPSDHQVPVLLIKDAKQAKYLACMMVVSMHPTVLHEDSLLVSADFPGMAKAYLKEHVFGATCPILYHSGPCGNQSPRHVVKANTFEEVIRLGHILGKAVESVVDNIEYTDDVSLEIRRTFINDPPRKVFPPVEESEKKLEAVVAKIERMKAEKAPAAQIRTVECDIFGAEEQVTMSMMQASGDLEAFFTVNVPAEIQAFRVGPWWFVGWMGEIFVDHALAVKKALSGTFIISMANGELQGYITTEEAAAEGGYEASNSLFTPQLGKIFVNATLDLIKK